MVASTVATDTPAPIAGVLGTAQDAALALRPARDRSTPGSTKIQRLYGQVDVIENESVPVPGTLNTFDLRAQNPHGPFGGPLLSLASGHYPATADEIAVTSGVAADFHLSVGSSWTVAGQTRKVTGIVAEPAEPAGRVRPGHPRPGHRPRQRHRAVQRPGPAERRRPKAMASLNVTTAQTVANTNEINPETISVAAAVLGMLLIALVGIGGFTVLAQRRLRAIGMLAAQGATERNIRLVVRANGAATGVVGAVAGFVLGFLVWLAYRPQAENSAHHVIGAFQLPWTVIGISMALAVIGDLLRRLPARQGHREDADRGGAGRAPARAEEDPPPRAPDRHRLPCRRVPPARRGRRGQRRREQTGMRRGRPRLRRARGRHRAAGPGLPGGGRRGRQARARSRSGSRSGTWPGTGRGPARRWRRSASAR